MGTICHRKSQEEQGKEQYQLSHFIDYGKTTFHKGNEMDTYSNLIKKYKIIYQ